MKNHVGFFCSRGVTIFPRSCRLLHACEFFRLEDSQSVLLAFRMDGCSGCVCVYVFFLCIGKIIRFGCSWNNYAE